MGCREVSGVHPGDLWCTLHELRLVPRQRFFTSCRTCTWWGTLWHFNLSQLLYLFSPICVWVSVKGEAYHETAEEPKPTCEMTPVSGRSPGSQMAVRSVMGQSGSYWFFRDGEVSSDVFPQKYLKKTSHLPSLICSVLLVFLWEHLGLFMVVVENGCYFKIPIIT